MTLTDVRPVRCLTGPCPSEPHTATELVEVLDTMRAVLGPPEAMDSPRSRAIYLLNKTRLAAACRY
jgi:hypothetical protein